MPAALLLHGVDASQKTQTTGRIGPGKISGLEAGDQTLRLNLSSTDQTI
jgi:hypothetical protein